ncbi:NAD-dependent epimerase/dehydratase family protein [Saccharopolyspora erythraea]|uniref:UDP-glucose 4-epimerase n=2 Tax=Saccharopolyspora erythraea TaxID=1836 RepID=A4FEZ5_SACEN|nr:NAD-dependent epimerase/dehydratase family protein [Saccharopolyspora erythraea]EQD82599.1 NAD-dependent dehydratase [Saccharopolyspora erythraea D]QRK92859.1 NAD-dependent epimerase/dehydratase family protein [Saccharopolyspora erythraea]CAM02620.1 UDP-glucose 4-epimerase [Saccharopolyspora erythraea NRRL 2338]
MRILVTGAAGFIGSHVADALAGRGHDVVLLDALLPQAHSTAPDIGHHLVHGDVRDAELVRDLLSGVEVVCHQAAMVGHGVDPSDMPDYASHNDHATAVLLAAMHATGVGRLVLASSMVVYGEGRYRCPEHGVVRPSARRQDDLDAGRYDPRCPSCGAVLDPDLVPEDAPLDPRSTYAATKLAQEHLAAAWARQTGGGVWALRYHNVYGPRMPSGTPYAGVASLFRSALQRGEAPLVLEDGRQRRDFVHVHDVAAANALAVEAAPPAGGLEAVNVCSGQPHTIGDMAEELSRAFGGPRPRIVGGARPNDVRHVVADPAKARRVLDFRAEIGFREGMTAFASDPLRAPVTLSEAHTP